MYMLVCTGIELLQISESPLLSFWLWTVCQTSPVREPCVIHIEVKSLVEEILVCTCHGTPCLPHPHAPNHLRSSLTLSAYTPVSLRCTLRKLAQPRHSCGQTKTRINV